MPTARERPASFSRPLIPRVIDLSKTQTRRVIAGRGPYFHSRSELLSVRDGVATFGDSIPDDPVPITVRCPYGPEGTRLWVREDHQFLKRDGRRVLVRYLADGAERWVTLTEREEAKLDARRSELTRPQPGRFMYRSCSRILIPLVEIRLERLQDISEEDARREGVDPVEWSEDHGGNPGDFMSYREGFREVWDRLNAERGYPWDQNDWVWVVRWNDVEVTRG